MIVYSIKDLENLSGIKAHTLRIWEKRYGILMPKRTDTNIRYYEDNDLQKVLNIALLRKKGYKISNKRYKFRVRLFTYLFKKIYNSELYK